MATTTLISATLIILGLSLLTIANLKTETQPKSCSPCPVFRTSAKIRARRARLSGLSDIRKEINRIKQIQLKNREDNTMMSSADLHMQPITLDTVKKFAPSAFATEPHHTVSAKYDFVSTVDAMELIMSRGWYPVFAKECAARSGSGKKGYQKHMIKFSRGQALTKTNQERLDLLLYNSHDRGSAFHLSMGVFRLVCSNGMIVGDTSLSFRHKHIGFKQDKFIASVDSIAEHSEEVAESIEDFKTIELTQQESGIYARAASQLVSDTPDEIYLPDLVRPRRQADVGNDLWLTYNKVQENVIRGGVRRNGRSASGRRKQRTKQVKSLDRDIKLNKALWTLTEEMRKLKTA